METQLVEVSGLSAILSRAYDLLTAFADDSGSEFLMIAPTPALGVKLEKDTKQIWDKALKARIASGNKTSVLCWEWEDRSGNILLSPSGSFLCKFLSRRLKNYQRDQAARKQSEFIASVWRILDEYLCQQNLYENFKIRAVKNSPFGLVLSDNGKGESRALIYFPENDFLGGDTQTPGFITSDFKWTRLAKDTFQYLSGDENSRKIEETRTKEQIKRDHNLYEKYVKSEDNATVQIGAFSVVVDKEVFPPDIALGTKVVVSCILETAKKLREISSVEKITGIDIGTGTGILALAMSGVCDKVYATDNYRLAVENAAKNFKRAKAANVILKEGDIFAGLTRGQIEGTALICFNYPYYPSPSNIFNTGGGEAGRLVVERFLKEAIGLMNDSDVIVMPYSTIAEEHNSVSLGAKFSLVSRQIYSDKAKKNFVYLFAKRYHPVFDA